MKMRYILLFFIISLQSFVKAKNENIKKALLVTRIFPTYTTEIMTTIMILKKLGYEVFVYACKRMCSMADHRVKFYKKLEIDDVYDRMYTPEKRKLVIDDVRAGKFDLVVGMIGSCGHDFATIKKKYKLDFTLLTKYTGADISLHYNRKKRKLRTSARYIDWLLPVSKLFESMLIKTGISPKKIKVLPSATLTNFFVPKKDKKNTEEFRILSVGRLIEKKGFDIAIKAIAQLVLKYPFIHYDIVGDGSLEKSLSKLIKKLNCEKNIHLIGKVLLPDIRKYYWSADLLLVPSRIASSGDREGIPRVAKEAAAMNIPVIATDCSGVQEIFTHKESSFIIESESVEDIISTIEYILHNKKILKQIKQKARDIILKDHGLEAAFIIFTDIIN